MKYDNETAIRQLESMQHKGAAEILNRYYDFYEGGSVAWAIADAIDGHIDPSAEDLATRIVNTIGMVEN